jgi:hypothetical protein
MTDIVFDFLAKNFETSHVPETCEVIIRLKTCKNIAWGNAPRKRINNNLQAVSLKEI